MKQLIISLVIIPLTLGIMSGVYTRKIANLPEYPLDILEEKGTEILENSSLVIAGTAFIPIIIKDESEPILQIYDIPLSEELQNYTFEQCQKIDLDPSLVLAVMKVESNFKSDLISKTNDYGLMQINKVNHQWLKKKLGITDFLNPKESIDCGIYMLADLFDKYSDIHQVLMAYNLGEGGMKRAWKKGIRFTGYSRKVIGAKEGIDR